MQLRMKDNNHDEDHCHVTFIIIVGVEGINKAWLWTNPLICGHGLEHKDHGRRDNVQKHTCCFIQTPNDYHNLVTQ